MNTNDPTKMSNHVVPSKSFNVRAKDRPGPTLQRIHKAPIFPSEIVGIGTKAGCLAVICAANIGTISTVEFTPHVFADGGSTMKVSVGLCTLGCQEKKANPRVETTIEKRVCYPKDQQTFGSSCHALDGWLQKLEVGQKLSIAGVSQAIEVVLAMSMHVKTYHTDQCELTGFTSQNIWKEQKMGAETRRLKKTVFVVTIRKTAAFDKEKNKNPKK